jgi:hypothetical protein
LVFSTNFEPHMHELTTNSSCQCTNFIRGKWQVISWPNNIFFYLQNNAMSVLNHSLTCCLCPMHLEVFFKIQKIK